MHHDIAHALAHRNTQRPCAAPRNAEACREKDADGHNYIEDHALNVRRNLRIFISKTLGCDRQVRMRVTRAKSRLVACVWRGDLRRLVHERLDGAPSRVGSQSLHDASPWPQATFITFTPHGDFGSNWYGMKLQTLWYWFRVLLTQTPNHQFPSRQSCSIQK